MAGPFDLPPPATLQTMLAVVYGVMAAGGVIAGPLYVAAGISGLRYRRRKLGMVALYTDRDRPGDLRHDHLLQSHRRGRVRPR